MRRLIAIFAAVALVLVLFAVAQLVLPGLAAQRLRDQLARSGQVQSVSVSAFPAIELLWHQADTVRVRLGRFRAGPGGLARLLDETGQVDQLSATASELDTGLLTLRDTSLTKHGDQLTGRARVTEADLRTAVPVLDAVTPVASSGGTLTLRGTATLFGVTAAVDATLRAQDGGLFVTPDVPFGGFATLRVFSDPRLVVGAITAAPDAGGFTVQAAARLR